MNSFISNTAWLTGAFVLGKLVGTVFNFYLAKHFVGAEAEYGIYMYLTSLFALFSIVGESSVNHYAQKKVAEVPPDLRMSRVNEIWPLIFGFKVVTGSLAAGLFLGVSATQVPEHFLSGLAYSLALFVFVVGAAPVGILSAIQLFRSVAVGGIISSGLFVVFAYGAVEYRKSAESVVLSLLAAHVVASIYYGASSYKLLGFPRYILQSLKARWYDVASLGVPLTIASAVFVVFFRVDVFFINEFKGLNQVGVYSLVLLLFFAISDLLWSQVAGAATPWLMEAWGDCGRRRSVLDLLAAVVRVYSALGTFAAISLLFVGEALFLLIFGAESIWAQAVIPLACLVAALPFLVVYSAFYRLLLVEGKCAVYLKLSIVVVALKIVGSYVLLKYYASAVVAVYSSHLMLLLGVMMWSKLGGETVPRVGVAKQLGSIVLPAALTHGLALLIAEDVLVESVEIVAGCGILLLSAILQRGPLVGVSRLLATQLFQSRK